MLFERLVLFTLLFRMHDMKANAESCATVKLQLDKCHDLKHAARTKLKPQCFLSGRSTCQFKSYFVKIPTLL